LSNGGFWVIEFGRFAAAGGGTFEDRADAHAEFFEGELRIGEQWAYSSCGFHSGCSACGAAKSGDGAGQGRAPQSDAEAHDLILKAMSTTDGPFNWEGEFFHYRNVNIWPRPTSSRRHRCG
jgi:hypothetical protein